MGTIPVSPIRVEELRREVDAVLAKLPADEVVRVRYNLGEDWSGDPAIFFRVVLTDEASEPGKLREAARRVEELIDDELWLYENWGLLAYFNFRSKTEQEGLSEPEWA